jgi:hypothetical protein
VTNCKRPAIRNCLPVLAVIVFCSSFSYVLLSGHCGSVLHRQSCRIGCGITANAVGEDGTVLYAIVSCSRCERVRHAGGTGDI